MGQDSRALSAEAAEAAGSLPYLWFEVAWTYTRKPRSGPRLEQQITARSQALTVRLQSTLR